jgi:hypothetical protein
MTPIAWMTAASLAAWIVATALAPGSHPELLFGMLGPLVSAAATWWVTASAHRRDPRNVTGVLVAGFGVRMVFVGLYMAVMLRVVDLRPVPFVVGFAGYLIGLYLMEALLLKRLFVGGTRSSSSA